jgi:hypothetical protein
VWNLALLRSHGGPTAANIIFFVALAVGTKGGEWLVAVRQVFASTDDFGFCGNRAVGECRCGVVSGRNETKNTVKVPRSQVTHSLTTLYA